MEKEYFKVEDVSAMLDVSRPTIYRWIKQGRINAIQFGERTIRIPKEEVENWRKGKVLEVDEGEES